MTEAPMSGRLSKQAALFVLFVAALLGAEVLYLHSYLTSVVTGAMDGGSYFKFWLTAASVVTLIGFAGVYQVLREGRFDNPVLSTYLAALCINLHFPGWNPGLWAVSLNFGIGFDDFKVSADVVGIVLLSVYRGLVRFEQEASSTVSPITDETIPNSPPRESDDVPVRGV